MEYLKPEMLIVLFEAEAVITTSGLIDTEQDPDDGFDFT